MKASTILYHPIGMGWTVQSSNPIGGEIFSTHPDWHWGPPCVLCNGYWVSLPGVMWPGHGINNPPPSSAKFKEK